MSAPQVVLRSVLVRALAPDGNWESHRVDAAGGVSFEEYLPARGIPHRVGQAHTPCWHYSTTTNRMIECESYLERVWMTLLDFDPDVVAYSAQPMMIEGADAQGAFTAFPDLFVRRADGRGLLLEVKNPTRLEHPRVQLTAARVAACAAAAGWGYRLVGAPAHAQFAANVMHLAGFRRTIGGADEYRSALLALAARPVAFGDLAAAMPDPAVARAVIQHLCWTGQLRVDLELPLQDTSVVQAAG
jgi:hypothetical protein